MAEKVDIEDVFGENEDWVDVVSLIQGEDFEGVTNVKDELSENDGWYNYSVITFDYKDKRYSFEYKEHTSDNVSDTEFFSDSFVYLGNVKDMSDKISREDLSRIIIGYENRIERLNYEKELLYESKELLDMLKPISYKNLKLMGKVFHDAAEKIEMNHVEKTIGDFFVKLSDIKR